MAGRRQGAPLYSPTAALRRRSINRGVLGGSRFWTILGAVLWGGRLLRRVLARQEQLVAREVLKPGQHVTIRALGAEEARSGKRRGRRS